jgi:hypothetical protein
MLMEPAPGLRSALVDKIVSMLLLPGLLEVLLGVAFQPCAASTWRDPCL